MIPQPIGRFAVAILCFFGLCAAVARAQNSTLQPLRVTSGAVLEFHLQTLLKPASGDPLAALPEGTIIRVRLLDSVDSHVNRDGDTFRGAVVSPVSLGSKIVIQTGAAVQGLLALLRSRSHPEGFRYELLITRITDRGKTYPLTASLDPSLFDNSAHHVSHPVTPSNPNSPGGVGTHGKVPSEILN